MQVRNSALILRPTTQPVREIQPPSERFAERQPQPSQPPVETVVKGELLSATQLHTARVVLEQTRVLEGQAGLDPRNRSFLQAYLDVETAGLGNRGGLDEIV